MFQLHSSEDVLAEVVHSLRRDKPNADGSLISGVRNAMTKVLDEIVEDFDGTVDYEGTDPNDRHVHAAAVASKADILLTDDAGFARMAEQETLSYEVYSADEFFILVDDSAPTNVQRAVAEQRTFWDDRRKTGSPGRPLVEALISSNCPEFAKRVDGHLRTLSGPTAINRKIVVPKR